MAEVSLNEIVNIARDPGEGTVAPHALINTTEVARTINQAAQFKAENDWRKYNTFMDNLKGVYKELGDIQGMPVAQADRQYLQNQAADVFKQIGDNPAGFFGGKMADIEKKIGNLRSQSAQSVQDQVFDSAHREYINRDPTLNTSENKEKLEGYFKQPLGQRKPYTLDLPSLWNPTDEAKLINTSIAQKFSRTGLTPDGKFINSETGIRYDPQRFKSIADQMYYSPGANGQTIEQQVTKRFKGLPAGLQGEYAKKYPDNPVKGFHDEMLHTLVSPDQVEKTDLKDNPYGMEMQKARDKSAQLEQKFGYDKIIEEMKLGGQKALAEFKQNIKDKSKKQQVGALNGMVDTMVSDAIGNAQTFTHEGGTGKAFFKMSVSPNTLKVFSTSEGSGVMKKTYTPDEIQVSQDGNTVRTVVYKQKQGKEYYPGFTGEREIDPTKTKSFSKNEFTARFGKDILGVSATEKEINADIDEEETETTTSSSTQVTVPATGSSGIKWK